MKKDNPFTLTFGKRPAEYISRFEATETIVSTFTADNPISQTYLIEGIRGSGKTVLMTAVTAELEQDDSYIIIDLNSTQNLLDDLAMRLVDSCSKFPDIMKQGFNISIAGFGVGVGGKEDLQDSISIIEKILVSLKKKNKKIIITIDEVQPDENMRRFASQFQIFIRKDYPLFLLMTGLYENIYVVQNDPALTFLLRAPKIKLDPLSLQQITKQYMKIFDIDFDTALNLANITKGYAFAFQALGLLYYEYREEMPLPDILNKLDDMLDDFVYRKIWESLSAQERAIVRAISSDETKVQAICKKTSITSASFSQYRERLIKRGIILSPRHGYVSLALPRFNVISKFYE
ncbi:AAA family ATPase [Butyrivibrio sp. DSM 10294]|uniref:AAA family ATPase n=1 Tax=Butyrivibrio sp. DSM 10294 TaxID=2972457 RepID=UPI00234FA2B4|nr:AAA family ATPase [Butyrivibrio sp. DSM 10294]MDC7292501.1 AAA family ATPase [Butyrivibrio sp. DSM 10294]